MLLPTSLTLRDSVPVTFSSVSASGSSRPATLHRIIVRAVCCRGSTGDAERGRQAAPECAQERRSPELWLTAALRDSAGDAQQDTEAVAGPASALALSASAASLKMRGLPPGSGGSSTVHSHSNSSSSFVGGQVGGAGRGAAPGHPALDRLDRLRSACSEAATSGSVTVRAQPPLT